MPVAQLGSSAFGADAVSSAERAWIASALEGDGRAFRALIEPHLAMLFRIAARVSGDRHLAEDAVQETLTIAYRRLGGYEPTAPFRAYLAVIAARQAHTLARAERRRQIREQAAAASTAPVGPTPEQALGGAEAVRMIRRILCEMPDKRREAALLRLDAGLSYREIAGVLDSSEGSARVLVHTAQRQLRERLADLLGGDEL